jgi:hypothetical protein
MEEEIRGEEAARLQAEEAEMMERLQEEIQNLPVSEHLLYMMHSLTALAVGRMGATAETAARRDLDQARLAIDGFKAMMEVVEPTRPADGAADESADQTGEDAADPEVANETPPPAEGSS